MFVVKRNGKKEPVRFDKVTGRLEKLSYGLSSLVDSVDVAKKVIEGIYDGVGTTELDNLAAETSASLSTKHPDYALLASRIAVSNLHKNTTKSFSETMRQLYSYVNPVNGKKMPLISEETWKIVKEHEEVLNSTIIYDRDFAFDYFGFKTLEKSYLLRINNKVVERPQHMYMRVSIGIHGNDIANIIKTYHLMSERWFTHATPTLFNAGTPKPQMSSCFLLTMKEDSIAGIYDTLKQTALISQSAGGIGIATHNIRATNSYIAGTNGYSNGLVPMLKVYNETARYVDQGGRRKGSFALYLEPWHDDIYQFLELRKTHGKEEMRARDLFYGLWIPDLFMKRVEEDGDWSLFCPNEAPGLADVHSEAFEELYTKYEAEGKARRSVKAQDLWFKIIECQIETGNPYMLYKDSANRKSNQKNLGTIRSSNLCTEVIEYTSPEEIAVCNLASLALPRFIVNGKFDHDKLYEVTYQIVINLNKVIDRNYYPVEEARNSNMRHRPIGIGVQGLADLFILLRYPFESEEARQLNKEIFETIYYAAMSSSVDLAKEKGAYETYAGSPLSEGKFQYDLWEGVVPTERWDWEKLRTEVKLYGARNSLLVAPMPTASTAQILGNNEAFEPYTSNIYSRRVLSGEFIIINKHLLKDLIQLGLWNNDMKNRIITANGSIQAIDEIPQTIKDLYKTVWEIKQKTIIDLATDRGAFVCQSQSMNLFMESPTPAKLTSMHFYSWKSGLKTGMYYLRTKAATQAVKFTVDSTSKADSIPDTLAPVTEEPKSLDIEITPSSEFVGEVCTMEDGCITCGS